MNIKSVFLLLAAIGLVGCEDPDITSTPVTEATEDQPYSYKLTAKDDNTSAQALEWTPETLPDWLSLNVGSTTPIEVASIGASSIAYDNANNLYLFESRTGNLYRRSATGQVSLLFDTAGRAVYGSVVVNNKLYFSDINAGSSSGGGKIRFIDLSNLDAGIQVFADGVYIGLTVKDGYLFAANVNDSTIDKFQLANPSNKSIFIDLAKSGVVVPYGIAFSQSGKVYVTSFYAGDLVRFNSNGQLDTSFANAGRYRTNTFLADVKIDSRDNLYIAAVPSSQSNYTEEGVFRVSADLQSVVKIAHDVVYSLTMNTDGTLYWGGLNTLKVFTLDTASVVLEGTPGDADVGENKVKIKVKDKDGDTDTQEFTITVANVNDEPTGDVTFDGDAREGATLTASNTLDDEDGLGEITYQWLRNGTAIDAATGETYTVSQADVGQLISVQASYTDGHDTLETVPSGKSVTPTNVNDAPDGGVTITGNYVQGQTLTATADFTDADGFETLNYQWYRNGVAIDGATASTYVLQQADVGQTISVAVSYTDNGGTDESLPLAESGSIANINDAPSGTVTIVGTAAEHTLLTIMQNLSDLDGLGDFSYQWKSGNTVLATTETYLLTAADIGNTITVTINYTDGFGANESVTSDATAAVVNTNDAPVGVVSISGTLTEGETLTASNNLTDADGLGTISYQWYADDVLIAGATAESYVLTTNEVGKQISVAASYTDGFGQPEQEFSAKTAAVSAISVDYTDVSMADVGNGTGGIIIQGVGFPDGQIGDAVASGDVNGDGRDDLIIGAHFDNGFSGMVYVIFGQPGGLNTDIDVANIGSTVDGFTITGSGSGNMGSSVAFVEDMNGDGKGEILIGAPVITDMSFNPIGGSYLVFGKSTNSNVNAATLATDGNGFAIKANSTDLFNGGSVAAAGDVNGDGTPDMLIGAYGANDADGAAYVVFGKATAADVDLASLGSGGFAMLGGVDENAGYSVASAGDITGDGKAEIIVSAPDDPSAASTKGKTYVVLGKADSNTVDLTQIMDGGSADAAGFAIIGEKNDDFSGDWIAAAGDINGDTKADFAIGASFFSSDGGTTRPGRTYVVFGDGTIMSDVDLLTYAPAGGFVIEADVSDDIHLGFPVTAAGDIDGDGKDDLLIGAFGTDPIAASGAAYLLFGKSAGTAVKVSDLDASIGGFKFSGVTNAQVGRSLFMAGDINGDGKADFMIGAPGEFRVYVVYGR